MCNKVQLVPESRQLISWPAIDKAWRAGVAVEMNLVPKAEAPRPSSMNEKKDEMGALTKAAVFNLKAFESVCRDEVVRREDFLRIAKDTAKSVHALMRLAQERNLMAIHDVLSENVGRVIGLGKELVKERSEHEEDVDAVLESEFVAAMKGMGETIKVAKLCVCVFCER